MSAEMTAEERRIAYQAHVTDPGMPWNRLRAAGHEIGGAKDACVHCGQTSQSLVATFPMPLCSA